MKEYIFSPYPLSATMLAKSFYEFGIDREQIISYLIELDYIEDIRIITPLGHIHGIDYKYGENNSKWPVYGVEIQKLILANIDKIKKYVSPRKEIKKTEEPSIKIKNDYIFSGTILNDYPVLGLSDFVIVDTETTGMCKTDEIIELAVVDTSGNVLYESTFKPSVKINPGASAVNGFTNAALVNSPCFADEWHKIKAAVGNKRLLGHNLSFDRRLTVQTLERYDIDPAEAYTMFRNYYDSRTIAKQYISTNSYSLENLAHIVGINATESHKAADDCLMTLEFLNRLELSLHNR